MVHDDMNFVRPNGCREEKNSTNYIDKLVDLRLTDGNYSFRSKKAITIM